MLIKLLKICDELLHCKSSSHFFTKRCLCAGIKVWGDLGEIVSLHGQTSPCSEPKEKFKCIEYIDKIETGQKLLFTTLVQISSLISVCDCVNILSNNRNLTVVNLPVFLEHQHF